MSPRQNETYSFWMLKSFRISSGVLPLIMLLADQLIILHHVVKPPTRPATRQLRTTRSRNAISPRRGIKRYSQSCNQHH